MKPAKQGRGQASPQISEQGAPALPAPAGSPHLQIFLQVNYQSKHLQFSFIRISTTFSSRVTVAPDFLCVKTSEPDPLLEHAAGAPLGIRGLCQVHLLGLEGPSHGLPRVPNTSTMLNGATGTQLLFLSNGKAQAWRFLVIFVNYDLQLHGPSQASCQRRRDGGRAVQSFLWGYDGINNTIIFFL